MERVVEVQWFSRSLFLFDFKRRRGDGGRARQKPIWTLLSAGCHTHSSEERPLGYSFGSPYPQLRPPDALSPSCKYLAINGRGRAKVRLLEMKKEKKKNPLSTERCKEWKPRAWLAEPVSQEGPRSPTLLWRRVGRLIPAGEPSRGWVRGLGLLFRRRLPALAARPPGPPRGAGAARRLLAEKGAPGGGDGRGQARGLGTFLYTRTKSAPAKERGRGGGFCGS